MIYLRVNSVLKNVEEDNESALLLLQEVLDDYKYEISRFVIEYHSVSGNLSMVLQGLSVTT